MSVSSTTTKVSYSGDGSQTVFAYTFKIFADADLRVIERASNGTETVKTLTTDYTVSGAGTDSGGNVTFGTAPASGVTVIIKRNLGLTQGTDYIDNDPFPAESHEDALDRLTFIAQNIQEQVDRCIKASETNTLSGAEFTIGASDRANKIFAFDSSGDVSITQEIGTFRGTDATTTTAAYNVRDLIKSTTAAQLDNIYICTATSVVGDLLTDTTKFQLIVDAYSAAASATAAASSATSAATSATTATTQASAAATSATSASTAQTAAETAQTAAETAQTAAETAQTAAEAALDTFDDRFLGAKSSDPTVDNDGNALIDGAIYFDSTNDIMKVYDLTNTQWRQLTLTSSNQTNVNTVAGQISPTNNIATVAGDSSDISTVAGISSDVTTVSGISANVTTVAGISANTTTVAGISSDVTTVAGISANTTTVAGISANVTTVAGISSDVTTVAGDSADIATVAGISSDVTAVGAVASNVTTVANNLTNVNAFADTYFISATAPSSPTLGDLWFDTTANTMKVYGSSGFQNAGSSVNGTAERQDYVVGTSEGSYTGSTTVFPATYDAGYVDVYLNGVKLMPEDFTATNGTSITLGTAAQTNDTVSIVGYGTFSVANLNASNLTSGTIPDARFPSTLPAVDGSNLTGLAAFPSGTEMLFHQTSAPTGWTKQTTHDDKAIRIVSGTVGSGGSSAFSTAFATPSVTGTVNVTGEPSTGNLAVSVSGNISNTTLTTAQIPSHGHSYLTYKGNASNNSGGNIAAQRNSTTGVFTNTGNAGSGGAHNHAHNLAGSVSGNLGVGNLGASLSSSTTAINVQYVDFIIAAKD